MIDLSVSRHSTWTLQKLSDLFASNSGVAAMEFAMIFPIFIAITYGTVEIANFNLTHRRAKQSVVFAAEYLSRDDDSTVSWEEIHVAEDIWQIVNKTSFDQTGGDAYRNSRGKYSRSFAGINFVKKDDACTGNNCEYDPQVDWSFLATQGISDPKRRNCDQTLVDNDVKLDENTLPVAMAGRSSVVVADFTYRYNPIINNGFFNDTERHITSIRSTRGGEPLDDGADSGHWIRCSY